MSARHLSLLKLHKLLRPDGLQRARAALLRSIPSKYLTVPVDMYAEYGRVLRENHPASLPARTAGPLRIAWIVPGIVPAAGGLSTIFRVVQHLESWGHRNRVYVLGSLPSTAQQARELVCRSYFPIKAEISSVSEGIEDSDVLIATSWPTAYEARGVSNTGRKFYFVQDLEHMFYPQGGLHEFARHTYGFGFEGITAGSWLAEVLRCEFGMSCTSFSFSYDHGVYATTGERMLPRGPKRVLFYARPATERRGFELGVLALMLLTKKVPGVELVLVGFEPDSVRLPFDAITPGVLPGFKLGALYRSCDAALVLSHTNLSLLPLELMACGCAIVSNTGPNTEWLLRPENTHLADADPESLAAALAELLENDDLRERKIAAGLRLAASTDWMRESKVIERALLATREAPVTV